MPDRRYLKLKDKRAESDIEALFGDGGSHI